MPSARLCVTRQVKPIPSGRPLRAAYSTLDGVYGIVTLVPLKDGYDPKNSLAPQFEETQTTGGKMVWQGTVKIGKPPLTVYSRIYQTAKLEDLKYSAAVLRQCR